MTKQKLSAWIKIPSITNPSVLEKKRIKSFIKREGHASEKQRRFYNQYWPLLGLSLTDHPTNFPTIFQRKTDVILEIGFGMGQHLFDLAYQNQDKNFIGVEVHRPGIGELFYLLAEKQLTNVRVFQEDVIDVLSKGIEDNSLTEVYILFPDPWPKRRHHKRRLIQKEFIELLIKKLKPGGKIKIATDWEDYANHIEKVFNTIPTITRETSELTRNQTKFERKGLEAGRKIFDFKFSVSALNYL